MLFGRNTTISRGCARLLGNRFEFSSLTLDPLHLVGLPLLEQALSPLHRGLHSECRSLSVLTCACVCMCVCAGMCVYIHVGSTTTFPVRKVAMNVYLLRHVATH